MLCSCAVVGAKYRTRVQSWTWEEFFFFFCVWLHRRIPEMTLWTKSHIQRERKEFRKIIRKFHIIVFEFKLPQIQSHINAQINFCSGHSLQWNFNFLIPVHVNHHHHHRGRHRHHVLYFSSCSLRGTRVVYSENGIHWVPIYRAI